MKYDKNNIFAKILRGEIPVKKFTKIILFFLFTILIRRKSTCLIIPKGEHIDLDDFISRAKERNYRIFGNFPCSKNFKNFK